MMSLACMHSDVLSFYSACRLRHHSRISVAGLAALCANVCEGSLHVVIRVEHLGLHEYPVVHACVMSGETYVCGFFE